jgi:hypothetical protein
VIQQSGATAATRIQRQNCRTAESPTAQTTDSDFLKISQVTPPCYACPNSSPDACPKLAQKIIPPVATDPVQFSWQVRFLSFYRDKDTVKKGRGKNTHVIQKIEKKFSFDTGPVDPYRFDPVYWEAFELNEDGQTEVDYWQFDIPDLTAGTWEQDGTLYLTDQLPQGMAVGNVPDASGAPSTGNEPKGLGRIRGTRRITGVFGFTGPTKLHNKGAR